ncbi:MAG: hypothetical protein V4695_12655 [Pseudomonadota bacterium]
MKNFSRFKASVIVGTLSACTLGGCAGMQEPGNDMVIGSKVGGVEGVFPSGIGSSGAKTSGTKNSGGGPLPK